MKNLFVLFLLTFTFCAFNTTLQAQNNVKISVQGTLKDANGSAVDNGQYDVIFRLYQTTSGGTALWQEEATVQVLGGVYSHKLGTTTPLNPADFDNNLYVGVEVEGIELTPRTELTYAPYTLHTQFATASGNGTPAGAMMPFAGPVANVPTGYVPCDGRALKSSDYPELFAAIGTTWGNGSDGPGAISGVTNFNVPDSRGRFLRGWDSNAGNDPSASSRIASAVGSAVGNAVGSYQGDANKYHRHSFSGTTGGAGAHSHSYTDSTDNDSNGGESANGDGSGRSHVSRTTSSEPNHTHSFSGNTSYNGSNGIDGHPKNIAVLYIIKI